MGTGPMDVLLVEDDDLVRATSAEVLVDAGLEVAEAASGEQALCMGSASPPAVLVTDVDLGRGMSGLDVAAAARRRWPGLGVLYITGRPGNLQGVPLRGRDRFLSKPFRAAALIDTVRDLMGSRPPLPRTGNA